MPILQPGTVAPDFDLPVNIGESVKLSNLRGKPVVLVFYPADWSPVCGDQLALYNEILPEFDRFGAKVVGVSVHRPWGHAAYTENRHLDIPLLSYFEPKGAVARAYGVYRAADGITERALFVLDADGI